MEDSDWEKLGKIPTYRPGYSHINVVGHPYFDYFSGIQRPSILDKYYDKGVAREQLGRPVINTLPPNPVIGMVYPPRPKLPPPPPPSIYEDAFADAGELLLELEREEAAAAAAAAAQKEEDWRKMRRVEERDNDAIHRRWEVEGEGMDASDWWTEAPAKKKRRGGKRSKRRRRSIKKKY